MKIALITLYNPEREVVSHVSSIVNQVDKVYLCDNSPHNNASMFSEIEKVNYLFYNSNLALSGAFNRVLCDPKIDFQDEDYILFFDQDSFVEDGHVQKLIHEYDRLTSLGYQVGCIGPLYFDRNTKAVRIPKVKKKIDCNTFIVDNNITSSLLCQYGHLRKIGFWNEDIFLDMADWDLCWRFMYAGMLCFITSATLLSHTVGNGEKKLGVIRILHGAPIMEYYQTRNYLSLLRKPYTPLRFRARFVLCLTIRPIGHLIILDKKFERLYYVTKGYSDFFNRIHSEYKGKREPISEKRL